MNTDSTVVIVWFTFRASTRSFVPSDPMKLLPRDRDRQRDEIVEGVFFVNDGLFLFGFDIGPKGAKALAEALKVNRTMTTVKWVIHYSSSSSSRPLIFIV
jgi:hypothetical protein